MQFLVGYPKILCQRHLLLRTPDTKRSFGNVGDKLNTNRLWLKGVRSVIRVWQAKRKIMTVSATLPRDGGTSAIPALQQGTTAVIAYTTVTNGSAYTGDHIIRLVATTDCHVEILASASATTSDMFLPANTVEYFHVKDGERVSVVQNASGGNLYVTTMV
jgi:hypothetical protein